MTLINEWRLAQEWPSPSYLADPETSMLSANYCPPCQEAPTIRPSSAFFPRKGPEENQNGKATELIPQI
jgi:hypothetical protein